ncbi:MAG: molybdopterin synthase catalytic subunit [Paraglaciecola sp.]|jgi:molybdopterin synthase catalytic subunit
MTQNVIRVQQQDFSLEAEYQALCSNNQQDGAVVTFIGLVRDFNQGMQVKSLFLEHYSGMTEKCLESIVEQARDKWQLGRVRVIHRIGQLKLAEQIVFVGVSASHRKNAFAACEFIMDYLKTQAPFWKKELSSQGETWLDARQSDQDAAAKWGA